MGDQVRQLVENYWYRIGDQGQEHECCGCGLTHDVAIKHVGGKLYWKWRLIDDEEASAVRDTGKPREKEASKAQGKLPKGKKEDGGDTGKHARGSKR